MVSSLSPFCPEFLGFKIREFTYKCLFESWLEDKSISVFNATDNKKGRINFTNDVTKTNSSFVIQFGNQETAAVTEQQQQWNEMGMQNISFCTVFTVH